MDCKLIPTFLLCQFKLGYFLSGETHPYKKVATVCSLAAAEIEDNYDTDLTNPDPPIVFSSRYKVKKSVQVQL